MTIMKDDYGKWPSGYTVRDADQEQRYIDAEEYEKRAAYEVHAKTKEKKEHKQSLLSRLIKKKIIFGSTLVFAPQKSPCLSNLMTIAMSDKVKVQVFDPLLPYGEKEPHIEEYDFVVIADLLEKLPDKMSKASIIKEALISLRIDSTRACVILAVRSKQTVKEMDEKKKDKLKMIEGIEADELESIATFAGAKSTWIIKDLEEEGVSYVGASFSNKKAKLT